MTITKTGKERKGGDGNADSNADYRKTLLESKPIKE